MDSFELGRDGIVYIKATNATITPDQQQRVAILKGGIVRVSDIITARQIAMNTLDDNECLKEVVFLNSDRKEFGKLVKTGKHLARWDEDLREYELQFFMGKARTPFEVKIIEWPADLKETYTNKKNCFNFALSQINRASVIDRRTGRIVAKKYIDTNGNGKLKWIEE